MDVHSLPRDHFKRAVEALREVIRGGRREETSSASLGDMYTVTSRPLSVTLKGPVATSAISTKRSPVLKVPAPGTRISFPAPVMSRWRGGVEVEFVTFPFDWDIIARETTLGEVDH
jgi:hypothetical protein